jgi:hypothetical protein
MREGRQAQANKNKEERRFPFPFPPYDIQRQFMNEMYAVLDKGGLGIFESPTGTVRPCPSSSPQSDCAFLSLLFFITCAGQVVKHHLQRPAVAERQRKQP